MNDKPQSSPAGNGGSAGNELLDPRENSPVTVVGDIGSCEIVRYRAALGAGLRERMCLGPIAKLFLGAVVGIVFLTLVDAGWKAVAGSAFSAIAPWIFGFVGWVLCCTFTLLLPDDGLYLDRLWCLIPDRNPLTSTKILWSKLQEVAIVDRNKDQKRSDFALKLVETSGAEHFIRLRLMDKDGLLRMAAFMKKYAPHVKGLGQLAEVERFFDYQTGPANQASYTQLWESSNAQFGLTSFTPLVPGSIIQGRFSVVKQIAAGGFSAIYLLRDEKGSAFVLKESVLPPALDESTRAKATEHFAREAVILAKLNHPRIAPVFDHFVENGRNYLRMQYVKGTNLRNYIAQNAAQPEELVVMWMKQLSEILTYLHELSPPVVHRDLSPDNIVVQDDGSLILIDFGAANEFIGSATGTLIGKHAYMAPEQIRGAAEPLSDIYSLGACAYFCLTHHDPEPIRSCSPARQGASVSPWLNHFVEKCTSLERDERFASARACSEYLKAPVGSS